MAQMEQDKSTMVQFVPLFFRDGQEVGMKTEKYFFTELGERLDFVKDDGISVETQMCRVVCYEPMKP